MPLNHPANLTTLSHGGGCGCKISPSLLSRLLEGIPQLEDANLLVGKQTNDDAAVYRIDGKRAVIATTDFFPPMVNDPFDFGRIAAANALSDIYAMGAQPALALNLLGMPVDKVSPEHIEAILAGGQDICAQAQCVIAGGHSLNSAEPFYGLAVIGFADEQDIISNASAQDGDALILSKSLGIGILSAAIKQGRIDEGAYDKMVELCTQLNSVGPELAKLKGVRAMCDVTGFGLLGHLLELCHPASLCAHLQLKDIPFIPQAVLLAGQGISTGAAKRNMESVTPHLKHTGVTDLSKALLCDPQTNGGLLIACEQSSVKEVLSLLHEEYQSAALIGRLETSSTLRAMITIHT